MITCMPASFSLCKGETFCFLCVILKYNYPCVINGEAKT